MAHGLRGVKERRFIIEDKVLIHGNMPLTLRKKNFGSALREALGIRSLFDITETGWHYGVRYMQTKADIGS